MPCIPLVNHRKRVIGYVCMGNEPVSVEYHGKVYRFEWTGACGWMPVNLDGSQRLTPMPKGAWEKLEREHKRGDA